MKKIAGSFVRGKLVKSALLSMGGAGIYAGLAIGLLIYFVFPRWISYGWGFAAYVIALAAIYIAIRVMERPSSWWNFENLKKGVDAETRVGQIIEYAIRADNCAVAHSVTEIAKVGDIDHIVATPVAIWVIETKYKRVPASSFSEVLNRIAANVDAVRQWAPGSPPVRGCLVLAYEETDPKKKIFEGKTWSGGIEKITVYTQESLPTLMGKIRQEAHCTLLLDEQIAKGIWKLGCVTE